LAALFLLQAEADRAKDTVMSQNKPISPKYMDGFTRAKALLEQNVILNLVADHNPDARRQTGG
jgi:hypothetical protein